MGCWTRKSSAWTTAIMVYTIVQSIGSAIWQIYQILLYENVVDLSPTSNTLFGAIYYAYYFHVDIWGTTFEAFTGRVHILAIAHLTVDIIWIFVSIIALSVKSKKNSAYGVNIFWMCTAVIELVIDVTSVSLFANDAITWQKPHLIEELTAAAIVMAIISSRFVLLLLINVCVFFGMVSITSALKNPPVQGLQHQQYQQQPQQIHQVPHYGQHRIVPLKPAMRMPRPPHLQKQDLSRVNNWYHHYDDSMNMPRNPNENRPNDSHQRRYEILHPQNLPLQPQVLPMNPKNLQYREQHSPMSPTNPQFHGQHLPISPTNLPFRGQNLPMSPKNPSFRGQNAPTANTAEILRQDQDPSNWYNVYDDMQPTHLPRVKNGARPHHLEEDDDLDLEDDAPSELSYTDQQNFVGDHTNVMVNGIPSGTLRRQLPWSYVHQPGMFPRKQTRDLTVDAPPVPVPDYTMRYNRNQRLDLDTWSQTSSSPGFPNRHS